jgi:membrane protein YdbS with pleckstrin-like domain
MRLVPNTDTVPASVNKYLLPHERQVVSVHQHPAVLIMPILYVLVGLALAGWLSNSVAHGNSTAILIIWLLWVLLVLWLAYKVFEWARTYFVITSQRMVLSTGIVATKVNMMPLTKVTDMSFQRTATGRLLGYGEFIVESAGQDQALSNVKFLPYPEQLYLEACGLIFKENEDPREPPREPPRDNRFYCYRGNEELASAPTLASLRAKLDRLDQGGGPSGRPTG